MNKVALLSLLIPLGCASSITHDARMNQRWDTVAQSGFDIVRQFRPRLAQSKQHLCGAYGYRLDNGMGIIYALSRSGRSAGWAIGDVINLQTASKSGNAYTYSVQRMTEDGVISFKIQCDGNYSDLDEDYEKIQPLLQVNDISTLDVLEEMTEDSEGIFAFIPEQDLQSIRLIIELTKFSCNRGQTQIDLQVIEDFCLLVERIRAESLSIESQLSASPQYIQGSQALVQRRRGDEFNTHAFLIKVASWLEAYGETDAADRLRRGATPYIALPPKD